MDRLVRIFAAADLVAERGCFTWSRRLFVTPGCGTWVWDPWFVRTLREVTTPRALRQAHVVTAEANGPARLNRLQNRPKKRFRFSPSAPSAAGA